MQLPLSRLHIALISIGLTLLLPLLLPIPTLFQWVMSRSVSVVWAELNPITFTALQILFVYGLSAAGVVLFMIKMRISKRLQPHYVSTRWWLVGSALCLIVIITNSLLVMGVVSSLSSDRELLSYIVIVGKIILLIASVRMLIGVLPRANKPRMTNT
jgi:hypothetical protein